MCHSGLRGGVSLALVMEMGDWVNEGMKEDMKLSLVDATFVLIVLYLLVFGSTTGPCLRCLGLPIGEQVVPGQMLYEHSDKAGWGWRGLMYFRRHFFVPFLIGRHLSDYHKKPQPLAEVLREA